MRRFLIKIILYSLPILLFLLVWFFFYGFPPPRFSNSISMNAKVKFIKEKGGVDFVDVLAIGSSFSLNNIHTETIRKNLSASYLNLSSWGQNIREDYILAKMYIGLFNPKVLIISTGYSDFNSSIKEIDYVLIQDYLSRGSFAAYKTFNYRYLILESKKLFLNTQSRSMYSSLMFDDFGGVNLSQNGFEIDFRRWKGESLNKLNSDVCQYNYLDSLSKYCEDNEVELLLVHSPYREGYTRQLSDEENIIISNHINRLDSIFTKRNQCFINTNKQFWEDSLYVDYCHLNEIGAQKYTEYFLEQFELRKNLVLQD